MPPARFHAGQGDGDLLGQGRRGGQGKAGEGEGGGEADHRGGSIGYDEVLCILK